MIVHLYTTLGCHLCEQAHQLLIGVTALGHEIDIQLVEISESDELIERYGVRIPVVQTASAETDIGWPFDQKQLLGYLFPPA